MMMFEQDEKNSDHSSSKVRGRTQIVADILYQCKENKRKSHVMQKANLNFDQVNHYLGDLQSRGLVEPSFTEDSRTYRTTDRGREFLDCYQKLIGMFKGHRSNENSKSDRANINLVKPHHKMRSKILVISFLLTIGLSMVISQSMPLVMTTTKALSIEQQQLAYAEEDNIANAFSLFVSNEDGDVKTMLLKATNDNGNEIPVSDFAITTENVISVPENSKVTVFATEDQITFSGAKITDVNDNTIDIPITLTGIISLDDFNTGVYTLDVIIDDRLAFECILVIGPDSDSTIINKQIVKVNNEHKDINIIKKTFQKRGVDKEKVCLFTPSHPICSPDKDGDCPDDWSMNEDGQCFPREVKCPAGYWRADDDETGACIPLPEEPNPIPEPPCAEGTIPDPEGSGECIIAPTEEEPEPEEELTANCGGVPCTPSEKEAGTGSDIIVEEEENNNGTVVEEETEDEPSQEEEAEDEEEAGDNLT
jgi:predicted transcriptional regulator